MTQEEKAKAYDEAIRRLEDIKTGKCQKTFMFTEGLFDYIFPELKESEDGRIRGKIIATIHLYYGEPLEDEAKEMIAWLKKQSDKDEEILVLKDQIESLHAAIKALKEAHKIELEKQGKNPIYNVPSREEILAIWDLGNEWKELTNGSISTEYGTQLDYIQKHWQESEYYLRAKQGKQKPVFEMKTPEESLGIDSDTYNKIVDECVYGEQKPANADLKDIVDKEANAIWKEINTGGSHSVIDSFNQFYGICMQVAEAVVDYQKPAEWKQDNVEELTDFENAMMHIGGSFFGEHQGLDPNDTAVVKEQAKCLLEIAHKPVEWSEDRSKELSLSLQIQAYLNTASDELYAKGKPLYSKERIKDIHKCMLMWQQLHNAYFYQKPAEWGEKDEIALGDALWCCKQAASIAKDENDMGNVWYAENWLKSIKDRYTWKPSDEQMKALSAINLTGGISYVGQGQELINLYNDLKKLKGE